MAELLEKPKIGSMSVEEFWESGLYRTHELIDGQPVEKMPAVFDHGEIILIVGNAIRAHVKKHKLGRVSTDALFLFHPEEKIRAPDVSFVSNAALIGQNTAKFVDVAPTLAVEVMSQNDKQSEMEEKAEFYLAHGSLEVWNIHPATQAVEVFRRGQEPKVYVLSAGDEIPGGDVLPGFSLPLKEIFED